MSLGLLTGVRESSNSNSTSKRDAAPLAPALVLVPSVAYVTFNSVRGACDVVAAYRNKKEEVWLGGKALNVQHSPSPEAVLWENLYTSGKKRLIAKLVTSVGGLFIVFISLCLLISAKDWMEKSSRNLNNANSSHANAAGGNVIGVYSNDKELNADYIGAQIWAFFACWGIALNNYILELFFEYRAERYEKHHSVDNREKSLMHRLFAFKFLNSIVIFMICNNSFVQSNIQGYGDGETTSTSTDASKTYSSSDAADLTVSELITSDSTRPSTTDFDYSWYVRYLGI